MEIIPPGKIQDVRIELYEILSIYIDSENFEMAHKTQLLINKLNNLIQNLWNLGKNQKMQF